MSLTTQTSTCPRPATALSFKPQQTQNTALVVEHRCLYTHDLRRKAKRWQDGVLRFHTFNKRIMVYDIPRNYIGDTHWREENPVQDGDEFELDRPVLVQVGEQSGAVEQDLTGLLEKRHKKNHEVNTRADSCVTSLSTPMVENRLGSGPGLSTHLRPRSLNAVLGTPAKTLGRASLPQKSPFELRRAVEYSSGNIDPPAKRQRIEGPAKRPQSTVHRQGVGGSTLNGRFRGNTEDLESGKHFITLEMSHSQQQSASSISPRTKPRLAECKTKRRPVLGRSREPQLDDLSLSLRKECGRGKEAELLAGPKIQSNHYEQLQRAEPREKEAQLRPLNHHNTPKKPTETMLGEPRTSVENISDSDMSPSSSIDQSGARSKLCVVSCKPRRKLMYKDLLLRDMPVVGKTVEDSCPNNESYVTRSKLEHRNAQLNTSSSQNRSEAAIRDEEKQIPPKHTSGELDQPPSDWATSPLSSQQPNATQQAKVISQEDRSLLLQTIRPIASKASSTFHSTNLALARMDQILLSQSQPRRPTILLDPSCFDASLPCQEPFLYPFEPTSNISDLRDSVSPRTLPKDREMQASPNASDNEIISSPISDTQAAFVPTAQLSCSTRDVEQALESLVSAASPKQTVSESPSKPYQVKSLPMPSPPNPIFTDPMIQHETIPNAEKTTQQTYVASEAFPAAAGAAKALELPMLPSSETGPTTVGGGVLQGTSERVSLDGSGVPKAVSSLPPFRTPCPASVRQRSVMKKSVSDTSAVMGAQAASRVDNWAKIASDANCANEHFASPWSKEAWDLFGCGRDGKPVEFKGFGLHEGAREERQ